MQKKRVNLYGMHPIFFRPLIASGNLLLRNAGGRASVGNPRMNCVADDIIDARWQIEAAPDEHTEMR